MLEHQLFQEALPVLNKIEQSGFQAYFVGGCVRDVLLQKSISDIDIATSAFPYEIKRMFSKTIDVGIEHGTVMVLMHGKSYEITTFRTESTYQDYRRPDFVTFVRNLPEDLKRRDFTMNALALDRHGKLYDFHNGQQDILNKCVRAVGEASERFNEDALRMMRAIRFSGQLDFYIEDCTQQGIQQHAHLLQKIAIERICIEWQKLMRSTYRQRGIDYFIQTNLYQYCPGFQHKQDELKVFSSVLLIYETNAYNWAVLLYCLKYDEQESKNVLNKWKLSNEDKHIILTILNVLNWRKIRQWQVDDLFFVGEEVGSISEDIAYQLGLIDEKMPIKTLYQNLAIKSIKDLVLTGKHIMQLLNKQSGGPYLGDIIEEMRQSVLRGHVQNDTTSLSEWVLTNYSYLKE